MIKTILLVIFFIFLSFGKVVEAQTTEIVTPKSTLPTTAAVEIPSTQSIAQVNILLERHNAAKVRLDKIAKKIASRLTKMKESKLNVTKLDSLYTSITKQQFQLESQSTKMEALGASFLKSSNPTYDYKLFRQQVTSVNTTLKTILAAEKNLVDQMNRLPSPTTKVSTTDKVN